MSKCLDALIAFALGDAFGVASECMTPLELEAEPISDMRPSKRYNVPPGSWSDDTSMTIATIASFIQKGSFDYDDIMSRWLRWLNNGEYTPNGLAFGVGHTSFQAIENYALRKEPLKCGLKGEYDNGNGAMMRMLPLALYAYYRKIDEEEVYRLTNELSSLTHAHKIARLGSYIYVRYVMYLLDGLDPRTAYQKIQTLDYSLFTKEALINYDRILKADIKTLSRSEIKTSAYVVDTLECALWIFLSSRDLKDVLLTGANIGGDTDTITAISASMAGIVYGLKSIPHKWLNTLKRKEYLFDLALKFEKKLKLSWDS